MHKIIKKYQTPSTTLPSFLEEGIPTQEEALTNFLKASANRPELIPSLSPNASLLKTAADKAAMDDMISKQNAASINAVSKSIDAQRSAAVENGKPDTLMGKIGSFGASLQGAQGGSALGGAASALSGVTDLASSFVDVDENSSFQQQQMVGDMLLKSGNPYAMAAGAAFKGLSVMDQALGINMNTINKNEAKVAGISKGERILNNIIGFLPGTGAGILAGKTDDYNFNEDLLQLGSSYSKSISDMQTMEGMAEGRYIFGKKKINDKIKDAKEDQSALTSALKTNTLRQNSDYSQNLINQKNNRENGFDYTMMAVGKHGMKLIDKESARQILELKKQTIEDISFFKDGGKMNILPEGKLHAHNHHLEDIDERLEDLTKKGIPIVTVDEDGTMSQVAEVEKEELILHLELTQQIEALWEQFKQTESIEEKNRIAFECGDLLCQEIITNTEDNVDLIKTL